MKGSLPTLKLTLGDGSLLEVLPGVSFLSKDLPFGRLTVKVMGRVAHIRLHLGSNGKDGAVQLRSPITGSCPDVSFEA